MNKIHQNTPRTEKILNFRELYVIILYVYMKSAEAKATVDG